MGRTRVTGDPEVTVEPWFEEPELVRQFPALFRAYAAYSRLAFNRSSGRVLGGSALLRLLARVTAVLGLPDVTAVTIRDGTLFIDLLDSRFLTVLHEARAFGGEGRILEHVLERGDSFVDVGANHGSYSMMAAAIVGPAGAVVACEPQPRLAALLRRSFQESGYRQAHVHEVACSDQEGTVDLFIPHSGSGSAGIYGEFSARGPHRRLSVRGARLDDLVSWRTLPGKVLLKLDVEGSELSALRGAERFIRERQPTVLFEINPASARAAGHTTAEVMECLRSFGYSRYAEVDEYPGTRMLSEAVRNAQRNVVAIPDRSPRNAR
jgi:FkbM family methyltransferase